MNRPAALRVAIVGTGMISELHRRAGLLAGADIIGVMGSTPPRSREVADRWGVDIAFSDIDQVIAERPDIVHVCTPNRFHYEQSMALIEAGINVVCEKPIGLTSAQADEMAHAAESAGIVTAVPFVYRFHPMVREIRARYLAGQLGDLALVHGSYLQDWMLSAEVGSWRVDPAAGGRSRAFADIGSHWCDLVEWVTGERFSEVSAATSIVHRERPSGSAAAFSGGGSGAMSAVTTEDVAMALFRTAKGTIASTTISQTSAGRKNRLWFELDATKGSAVFDQENPESAWFGALDQSTTIVRDGAANHPDAARLSQLPAGHPQGYAQCFEAFVADAYVAIEGQRPDGLPSFSDGARSARIVDAVLHSAESGIWAPIRAEANLVVNFE